MKQLLLSGFVALFASVAVVSSVGAIQYGNIGGKPANPRTDNPRSKTIFIHSLEPGDTAKDGIKIFNNTDAKRDIAVHAVDAILASDGSLACAQQVETPKDAGKWIKLKANKITLAAGQDTVIPFTITPPEGADVGEHNGCITIQDISQKPVESGESGVTLSFRSALRIAVTIPGEIVKSLEITDVAVSKDASGSYVVTPTVQNEGNVSLDTDIVVGVESLLGTQLEQSEATYPILPKSGTRWDFSVEQRSFWGGWYRATAAASYDASLEAELGQESGEDQRTVTESSAVFFMMPSLLGGLIEAVIVAIIIAVIVFIVRRRQSRRYIANHWQEYRVTSGQTLKDIADERHISWKKLARANQIKAPYIIEPKQSLKVPPIPSDKKS